MTTITEFLTARLDEDEAAANEYYTKRGSDIFTHQNALFQAKSAVLGLEFVRAPRFGAIEYEALNRVLAEVAAKRAVVAECANTRDYEDYGYVLARFVLGHLAAPYADHPDYDESWRP